jgi:hypothetical protein
MLPLHFDEVPYQDNGCDCGMYVCRYAYGMYRLRSTPFTFEAAEVTTTERNWSPSPSFCKLISKSPAFEFNATDVARMRKEMEKLIERLSNLYMRWKSVQRDGEGSLGWSSDVYIVHKGEMDLEPSEGKFAGISKQCMDSDASTVSERILSDSTMEHFDRPERSTSDDSPQCAYPAGIVEMNVSNPFRSLLVDGDDDPMDTCEL